MSVRVRFAPSPTGPLHIGGVRTALYNYLFAKKNKGSFILRIEDTDQVRLVPGTEEYIIESLKWCGILPNEGVGFGGAYEPYRQSDRKAIYVKYAQELVDKGCAYYAFDTAEELDQKRNSEPNWKYDYNTRSDMKTSLGMADTELQELLQKNVNHVIRLKIPKDMDVVFNDIIRGDISINTSSIDDKVIFKSDGLPTYHLANVVDDHLMEITHVIRGEEWLPSTPLHVLLYTFFGWKMPLFAHLPLILKPDGKGKLSKRDGDKMGMPVFPIEWNDPQTNEISNGYREQGYSKEAFLNMLAFLGWNPGTEKEIYTLEELVNDFSLERVHKAGAKFDPDKTKWFNQQHLKLTSEVILCEQLKEYFKQHSIACDLNDYALQDICVLMKERVHFLQDIYLEAKYLFGDVFAYDKSSVEKKWNAESTGIVSALKESFSSIHETDFTSENIEVLFKEYIEDHNIGFGAAMVSLRLVLTGQGSGPSLFHVMEILGKEISLNRMTGPFLWEK